MEDLESPDSLFSTGPVCELAIQFEDIFKEMMKLINYYRYSLHKDVTKILLNGDHPMIVAVFEDMKENYPVYSP